MEAKAKNLQLPATTSAATTTAAATAAAATTTTTSTSATAASTSATATAATATTAPATTTTTTTAAATTATTATTQRAVSSVLYRWLGVSQRPSGRLHQHRIDGDELGDEPSNSRTIAHQSELAGPQFGRRIQHGNRKAYSQRQRDT